MLIKFEDLPLHSKITGVIHIGAHECEERDGYINHFNLDDSKIIWIEAIAEKVLEAKTKYPNIQIYNECIGDTNDKNISFIITNNFQSSSMFELKTHKTQYPHITEIKRENMTTKKIKTLFQENNIDAKYYNFLNMDIQGAELLALKGFEDMLNNIEYIYTEVSTEELYENCALLKDIDEYLEKNNFKRIITNMTSNGWGDAFYIKQK